MNYTIQGYTQATQDKKQCCLKFYNWAMEKQLHSFKMVIADDKYYDKSLEERRAILSAPSINFLCKTIVFENTAYNPKFQSQHYRQYIAVVVQYVAKIHTQKLNKIMRVWQQNHSHDKAAKQYFHFRLADEQISAKLTGYQHNGVIPILMKTNMPVILSHHIQNLHPQCFWMGGGHPQTKMRLSLHDFIRTYPDQVLVDDITYQ